MHIKIKYLHKKPCSCITVIWVQTWEALLAAGKVWHLDRIRRVHAGLYR